MSEKNELAQRHINKNELARRHIISLKNFNKIFCVGQNKTATTTLERILMSYGYRMPNQQKQELLLSGAIWSTQYDAFSDFVRSYDAFQDLPFSTGLTFVAADALFPNSKFILTERDPEAWFNSMLNYTKKLTQKFSDSGASPNEILSNFTYLFPGYVQRNTEKQLAHFKGDEVKVEWDLFQCKDYHIEQYLWRNSEIKRYFYGAPHKLLVIDLTKEKTTKRICEFLDIPLQYEVPVPHENKT